MSNDRNDRSRMYWTPSMEHFFIDLMLEHIHRGNRMGHTFNKQAWADMLAVFNAKFGSLYDKDVLKSRYTNLWKQYNSIKILLAQSGFSWDETREMVVADDNVWDAYIKAHPDARPYKTKSVGNFNDLSLIYGYTAADGRYSRSSHDADIDDEMQGVNLGSGTIASATSEPSKTYWTTDMDQYFIELMLNQQKIGNKLGDKFSKRTWTDILILFNAKFGSQYTKRVLRHRYRKLFKYYTDITVLSKQNGFFWDEKQHSVAANDDVWDAYIKGHPHARSYRTKLLPYYNDLGLIFGDKIYVNIQHELQQDLEDPTLVAKSGSERSRTYWTPPMDHYLIDLLLDQVHRGNRIEQTFISQCWIDMVTSFNINFSSNHDKDVLKSRFKHLKRQYNDVKALLEQVGFSWDETREMVTADDHVWDAYIEAHPNARSYRVKTVPNYHKLCTIFGEDSFDRRYRRLACNIDSDTDCTVIRTAESKECHIAVGMNPVMDWTPPVERYFIDLMLEQMHKGSNVDQTFVEAAWNEMITSFTKKFGLSYDKNVLENRFMCLMNQYWDVRSLLNQQGFTWDDTRQTIVADDDTWEVFIKEHPHTICYRGKILGYYKDLCSIFGSGIMDEQVIYQSMGLETDSSSLAMESIELRGDPQASVTKTQTFDGRKRRTTIMPSVPESPNKLKKTGKEIEEAVSDVANEVSKLVNKKDENSSVTLQRAIDALQALQDIDDELLVDACDLFEDERKADIFLALDPSLRKKWLFRKLRRL